MLTLLFNSEIDSQFEKILDGWICLLETVDIISPERLEVGIQFDEQILAGCLTLIPVLLSQSRGLSLSEDPTGLPMVGPVLSQALF